MENCKTLYPILMVHGMGFRDGKINYWGRIPKILENHGAEIYYGYQEANAPIEYNAKILEKSLKKALEKSGAEKVNIIAHSKGGMEARYMISALNMGDKVASLTTLSCPHNGSVMVDKLMKFPDFLVRLVALITDITKRIGGDRNPDTYTCFKQLTTSFANSFNAKYPDNPNICYNSYAFLMKSAVSDLFMSFSYLLVKLLDGENDGFLTPEEVKHGNFKGVYTGTGRRGISHYDEVDLRRKRLCKVNPKRNNEISDITDFYVGIVSELRQIRL